MRISDWSSDVCSSDLRGSSILVSGVAGAGKSSVAASIVDAACSRGEKALYFSFEESEFQTVRNMRSIGIDLQKIGRAHVCTPVTNAPHVCRHLLENKTTPYINTAKRISQDYIN